MLVCDFSKRDELNLSSDFRRSLRVQLKAKKDNKVTARAVSVDEKEVALRRKIVIWSKIQSIYMPCVDTLRPATRKNAGAGDDDNESEVISAADIDLYLPEALPSRQLSQLVRSCSESIEGSA